MGFMFRRVGVLAGLCVSIVAIVAGNGGDVIRIARAEEKASSDLELVGGRSRTDSAANHYVTSDGFQLTVLGDDGAPRAQTAEVSDMTHSVGEDRTYYPSFEADTDSVVGASVATMN